MTDSALLNLLKKGRDAWNRWAAEDRAYAEWEAGSQLGGMPIIDLRSRDVMSLDLRGYIFPRPVKFNGTRFNDLHISEAKFKYGVDFDHCIFKGNTIFYKCEFQTICSFEGSSFEGDLSLLLCDFGQAEFQRCRFAQRVFISACSFKGVAAFDNSEAAANFTMMKSRFKSTLSLIHFSALSLMIKDSIFEVVPDLRGMKPDRPAVLDGNSIRYKKAAGPLGTIFYKAANSADAARYRRLRQIATESRDHEEELQYLSYELRAKRFYSTDTASLLANLGYDLFSGFGRSLFRPVLLFSLSLGVAVLHLVVSHYSQLSTNPLGLWNVAKWLFVFGLTSAFALVGGDKLAGRQAAIDALFGPSNLSPLTSVDFMVIYLQSAASLLALFLIGLALRNRFRISGSSA
jgi:hypothetical protein